ncbi:hypothetical protein ASPCADRAFT_408311 [Aspergillus carbonarius ITEM 5010]|uniref:Uncharacterized protein n=1 Tax=Aspergillus carbonarius (strain ITEM 5010) TaxID=602072 RepID=A0A1R3REE1_ASPC5|nr:hypothetical protein ASPCADRAFT_408311 [Aspergillus carbonarius ITEM 5010]
MTNSNNNNPNNPNKPENPDIIKPAPADDPREGSSNNPRNNENPDNPGNPSNPSNPDRIRPASVKSSEESSGDGSSKGPSKGKRTLQEDEEEEEEERRALEEEQRQQRQREMEAQRRRRTACLGRTFYLDLEAFQARLRHPTTPSNREGPRLAHPPPPAENVAVMDFAYISSTIPSRASTTYPGSTQNNTNFGIIQDAITQTADILDRTRRAWRIVHTIEQHCNGNYRVSIATVHVIQVREMAESLFEYLEKTLRALQCTRYRLENANPPADRAIWAERAGQATLNAYVTMLLYQDLFEDVNFTLAGYHAARAETLWRRWPRGVNELQTLRDQAREHKATDPVRPLDYVARTQIPLTGPPQPEVHPHPLHTEFVEGAVGFMQVSQNLLKQGPRVRPTR